MVPLRTGATGLVDLVEPLFRDKLGHSPTRHSGKRIRLVLSIVKTW